MKLMLIEDDPRMTEHLAENLKHQGILSLPIRSLAEIQDVVKSNAVVDFIVMDRLLENFDTKAVLPMLRQKWPGIPIIVISAISTPNERTDLINLGADDYLGKPFSTQELVARMKALLRRTSPSMGNFIQVGNLIIDSVRRCISVGEKQDTLPAREFTVLRALMVDPTRIWSKEELLDYVWGQVSGVETNVVEATIANIRKKLIDLQSDATIKNMRNVGYWIAK